MRPDETISDESGAPQEVEPARPQAVPVVLAPAAANEQAAVRGEPSDTANQGGLSSTSGQVDDALAQQNAEPAAAADSVQAASESAEHADPSRRGFLAMASGVAMGVGLAAGYGTFFAYLGRFLYPAERRSRGWVYVAKLAELAPDSSLTWKTPSGQKIVLVRRGNGVNAADFTAFSSVCPHLGCQVHWESNNKRFFCPCHNGVFDPSGKATGGPPGDAGQSLVEFPVKVEAGLLFVEVSLEALNV